LRRRGTSRSAWLIEMRGLGYEAGCVAFLCCCRNFNSQVHVNHVSPSIHLPLAHPAVSAAATCPATRAPARRSAPPPACWRSARRTRSTPLTWRHQAPRTSHRDAARPCRLRRLVTARVGDCACQPARVAEASSSSSKLQTKTKRTPAATLAGILNVLLGSRLSRQRSQRASWKQRHLPRAAHPATIRQQAAVPTRPCSSSSWELHRLAQTQLGALVVTAWCPHQQQGRQHRGAPRAPQPAAVAAACRARALGRVTQLPSGQQAPANRLPAPTPMPITASWHAR